MALSNFIFFHHLKANILRFAHVGNFLLILLYLIEKKLVDKGYHFFKTHLGPQDCTDITANLIVQTVVGNNDGAIQFPKINVGKDSALQISKCHCIPTVLGGRREGRMYV